jgi:hypothetical protein
MNSYIKYELIRFKSSKDQYFYEALKIYSSSIDYEQKTSTNEITYWVNNLNKFRKGEILLFALVSNNTVIGFAELSYIKEEKILIIDYIIILETYKSNSAFYSFYSLIISYINDAGFDYNFITKEILCRYDETQRYLTDIRMYELEEFKVANCLYIHPQLEKNNVESEKEALVMIYQKANSNNNLKKETYIQIISYIYNYYYEWDSPFFKNNEENGSYLCRHKNYLNKIIKSLDEQSTITLNGYPYKLSVSTDGSNIPNVKKNKIISHALIHTSILIILVLVILFFAKELNVELTTVALVSIAVLFVTLSFISISDSKAAHIIKKLPLFSKLFELLK